MISPDRSPPRTAVRCLTLTELTMLSDALVVPVVPPLDMDRYGGICPPMMSNSMFSYGMLMVVHISPNVLVGWYMPFFIVHGWCTCRENTYDLPNLPQFI